MMMPFDLASALPSPATHPTGDELFRLGLRYSTGLGGAPLDVLTAHTLFNLASARGSVEAKVYRKDISSRMDPSDIAESRRVAREWLRAA